MGTAPRSPPHAMNTCSRSDTRNGTRHTATDIGLATNVSAAPTITAVSTASGSRDGLASRPSIVNRPICASQARDSQKPWVVRACGSFALPTTTPAT